MQIDMAEIDLGTCCARTKMPFVCSYTMICPPVNGGNPQAVASGLSPVQADKPWYNYFIPSSSV